MSHSLAVERQGCLLELFKLVLESGVRFAKISQIDQLVAERKAALILKHDVHGMDLDGLVDFAQRENKMGINGTYFFMPSKHPVTTRHFDFEAQLEAMRAVAAEGHELGLHIDPYFQIQQKQLPLKDVLREILDEFAEAGLSLNYANMHGNSQHKHLDKNSYGTSFDLFAEIGRQPDFPTLAHVPEGSAAIIRANRVSLADFEITHWGDMPVWSAKSGFVLTNFITDNWLGKQGTVEVLIRDMTLGAYCLADTQPPGSRNISSVVQRVKTTESGGEPKPFHGHVPFDAYAPKRIANLLKNGTPILFLIHPENYC